MILSNERKQLFVGKTSPLLLLHRPFRRLLNNIYAPGRVGTLATLYVRLSLYSREKHALGNSCMREYSEWETIYRPRQFSFPCIVALSEVSEPSSTVGRGSERIDSPFITCCFSILSRGLEGGKIR